MLYLFLDVDKNNNRFFERIIMGKLYVLYLFERFLNVQYNFKNIIMWLLDIFMFLDFVLLIGEIFKLISKREVVIMKDFWDVFIY